MIKQTFPLYLQKRGEIGRRTERHLPGAGLLKTDDAPGFVGGGAVLDGPVHDAAGREPALGGREERAVGGGEVGGNKIIPKNTGAKQDD